MGDRHPVAFAAVAAALAAGAACASDPPTFACVEDVKPDCSPQYLPAVYGTIFEKILRPTCASGRGTCHTADGAKGGLVFDDADTAYDLLLGRGGSPRADAVVVAGDPACSTLVKRLYASDPAARMPPGPTGLSAGEICTFTRWIGDGAPR